MKSGFVGLHCNKYQLILMQFYCEKLKEPFVVHNSLCVMVIPATHLSV